MAQRVALIAAQRPRGRQSRLGREKVPEHHRHSAGQRVVSERHIAGDGVSRSLLFNLSIRLAEARASVSRAARGHRIGVPVNFRSLGIRAAGCRAITRSTNADRDLRGLRRFQAGRGWRRAVRGDGCERDNDGTRRSARMSMCGVGAVGDARSPGKVEKVQVRASPTKARDDRVWLVCRRDTPYRSGQGLTCRRYESRHSRESVGPAGRGAE